MSNHISFYLRLRQLSAYVLRAAAKYLKINKTIYVQDRIPEYRKYWQEASDALSLEFVRLTDELWEINNETRKIRIATHKIPINDPVVLYICADKLVCYNFAVSQNIPVPQHRVFRLQTLAEAKNFIKGSGAYVVKPARGTGSGQGVTTQIQTSKQLERAAILASTYCQDFIVEKMVLAESIKLFYLDGQFIHASRRRGVRVIGDGQSTIKQLMLSQGHGQVSLDLNAVLTLEAQGLSFESIPSADREILVRSFPGNETSSHELRTVYDETITDLVGPELAIECACLVREVGCDIASVDVITEDPGESLKKSGGVFIEINADPGIHHHYNNENDHKESVAKAILKYLFEIK